MLSPLISFHVSSVHLRLLLLCVAAFCTFLSSVLPLACPQTGTQTEGHTVNVCLWTCTICPHVSMLKHVHLCPWSHVLMRPIRFIAVCHHFQTVTVCPLVGVVFLCLVSLVTSPSHKPLGHFTLQLCFLWREEVRVAIVISSAPRCWLGSRLA